jgi:Flp pilus assembly protein TadD
LAGRPDAKAFERAEPTLAAAIASHKDDAALLASVATVRLVQKRPDDACKLLQQALQLQPKNVTALNNLAAILGEQPQKQEEALRYVNQAIDILGPQPQLLDTKAMICLFAGKPDEAARLLEEAVLTPNPDPRYFFHLAAAYYRKNDLDKFRAAMAKVRLDDLATTLLTEADEKLLAELRSKSGS